MLRQTAPGILHTGSLMLVPPNNERVTAIVQAAKSIGWIISVDVNLRPKLTADLTQYIAAVKKVAALADWFKASDEDLIVDGKTAEQNVPAVAVIDTVGAGDTFWGNCLADWVMHPTGAAQRVATTLGQAMQAAAINCSRAGCQPPRFGEILSKINLGVNFLLEKLYFDENIDQIGI